MSPNVLSTCWSSGSQTCPTVGLVVCHTASASELLSQAFDCVAIWDFPPWEFAMKLPSDKNNWFCCKVKF